MLSRQYSLPNTNLRNAHNAFDAHTDRDVFCEEAYGTKYSTRTRRRYVYNPPAELVKFLRRPVVLTSPIASSQRTGACRYTDDFNGSQLDSQYDLSRLGRTVADKGSRYRMFTDHIEVCDPNIFFLPRATIVLWALSGGHGKTVDGALGSIKGLLCIRWIWVHSLVCTVLSPRALLPISTP
jgi:hypothetical protein